MRDVFCFVLLAVNISCFSQSNEHDLEDMATGLMAVMPDVPEAFTRHKIIIENLETKEQVNRNVVIISDKKSGLTVMAAIISNNLYYVFGYSPVIREGKFTKLGEFILIQKKDGVVSKVKHSVEFLSERVENNEIIEHYNGDKGEYIVAIKNKLEVWYVSFQGLFWTFPINYFEYKN